MIRGHFPATRPHLIYGVKGFETFDVEGSTSIIQKVTIAMSSGRTLNELVFLKRDLLTVKILVP